MRAIVFALGLAVSLQFATPSHAYICSVIVDYDCKYFEQDANACSDVACDLVPFNPPFPNHPDLRQWKCKNSVMTEFLVNDDERVSGLRPASDGESGNGSFKFRDIVCLQKGYCLRCDAEHNCEAGWNPYVNEGYKHTYIQYTPDGAPCVGSMPDSGGF